MNNTEPSFDLKKLNRVFLDTSFITNVFATPNSKTHTKENIETIEKVQLCWHNMLNYKPNKITMVVSTIVVSEAAQLLQSNSTIWDKLLNEEKVELLSFTSAMAMLCANSRKLLQNRDGTTPKSCVKDDLKILATAQVEHKKSPIQAILTCDEGFCTLAKSLGIYYCFLVQDLDLKPISPQQKLFSSTTPDLGSSSPPV